MASSQKTHKEELLGSFAAKVEELGEILQKLKENQASRTEVSQIDVDLASEKELQRVLQQQIKVYTEALSKKEGKEDTLQKTIDILGQLDPKLTKANLEARLPIVQNCIERMNNQ